MHTKITMGNDEFILYIRKNYTCTLPNDVLGKKIWERIQFHDNSASKEQEDVPCKWGKDFENNKGFGLPKTAAQFKFEKSILPQLYTDLDELGLY